MNKKLVSNILIIVTAALALVFALVLYIGSFEVYSDEWGTDISFNKDYLVSTLVCLLLVAYSIANFVNFKKNRYNRALAPLTVGVSLTVLSFYSLGAFLKPLFKGISKGSDLGEIFKANQTYLYFGIIGVLVLAIVVINNIDLIKKNK